MTHVGQMIVYFNRHQDAPRVWCIAPPDRAWEIQVQTVIISVPSQSHYNHLPSLPNHDGPPSALFQVAGSLVVDDEGNATITESGA